MLPKGLGITVLEDRVYKRRKLPRAENSIALLSPSQEFRKALASTYLWGTISKQGHAFPCVSAMATDLGEAGVQQSSHWSWEGMTLMGFIHLEFSASLTETLLGLHCAFNLPSAWSCLHLLPFTDVGSWSTSCTSVLSKHMLPENAICNRRRGFQGDSKP